MHTLVALTLAASLSLAACGDDDTTETTDAGHDHKDAGSKDSGSETDSGTSEDSGAAADGG